MSERTWMQKTGATPGKLALVVCLSLGLVFVLWNQQSGGADNIEDTKKTRQTEKPHQEVAPKLVTTAKPAASEKSERALPSKWPKLPLESVLKNDPFAMPAWYLAAIVENPQDNETALQAEQRLEQLRKEQTKIVVISNGERIATIGNQRYRVGDTIAGYEITEIGMDGVVLTEIDR